MADGRAGSHSARLTSISMALLVAALALTLLHLWTSGLTGAQGRTEMGRVILEDSVLPRIATALLAGAMLSLSGVLFQHVLHNPLAEPTTLGVSGGAYLALAIVTLLFPDLSAVGRDAAALAGALSSGGLVFALSWTSALSASTVLMAGLVLALLCGSLGAVVAVLRHDQLDGVSLWTSGVLDQYGWDVTHQLAWKLAVAAVAAALLARPLALLELDDAIASGLGLSLRTTRLAGLALATLLAGSVVGAIGVIGFVGLAAPWFARAAGAQRLGSRMAWATLIGALLLWLVDAAVQCVAGFLPDVPTGTATAALGCPLLILLLRTPRAGLPLRSAMPAMPAPTRDRAVVALVVLAVAAALLSLVLGRGPGGWHVEGWQGALDLLPYRAPRLGAAAAAGAMMAGAGVLLQRMTGNPLAAPEVLGIAPGVALGVIAGIAAGVPPDFWSRSLAGLAGAVVTVTVVVLLGRRQRFHPDRMLLGGIALGTMTSVTLSLATSIPDPRFGAVLSWMVGATDDATPMEVRCAVTLGAPSLLAGLLALRWLAILPLGDDIATGIGVDLAMARLFLFALATTLTTGATLIIGPLSFIGLMAPHMARQIGLTRPLGHYGGSIALGLIVMIGADWLGRSLLFPYTIPAGLLASLLGAPYVLVCIGRQPR